MVSRIAAVLAAVLALAWVVQEVQRTDGDRPACQNLDAAVVLSEAAGQQGGRAYYGNLRRLVSEGTCSVLEKGAAVEVVADSSVGRLGRFVLVRPAGQKGSGLWMPAGWLE
jgi:hypothetical protein